MSNIEIRHVMEHYEAWCGNEFIVSGDTRHEVEEELKEIGY